MGKNNIRKGILRSLCAAVTAFAAAAVPVMGGTTFADTKDYDQEIAQLEQKAEQIKKDNEAREQQIGSLKSDVAENEQKMGLLQEQINGINDEVKTYGQLITTQLHFNGVPHGGCFAQRYLGAGGQPHIQQVVAQLALTAYHADDCILPNVQVT